MTVTIAGVVRYDDVVLMTDTLEFKTNSTLVLAPVTRLTEQGGPSSSAIPRTLTIVADRITIEDHAEITYDLDGLSGYDPDTPAPPQGGAVSNGGNGSSIPGEGSYPQASNGGDGGPGATGLRGNPGINAPTLEIFANEVTQHHPDAIKINFKGQDGGKGGKGGEETEETEETARKEPHQPPATHGTTGTNALGSLGAEETAEKEETQGYPEREAQGETEETSRSS